MNRQREIYMYVALRANTIHSVGALILNRWIPPTRQVNYVICACESQSNSASARRQNHLIERTDLRLEFIDQGLSLFSTNLTVYLHRASRKPISLLNNQSEML